MRLHIWEDHAERLEPLSLTRPVFDLRCGMTTLAQKQARHVGLSLDGVWVRCELEELYRHEHPRLTVNEADRGGDTIYVNGRWLPPEEPFAMPAESCVGMVGAEVAYVVLRNRSERVTSLEQLLDLLERIRQTLPAMKAGGDFIAYPWDLVDRNPTEIRRDFAWLEPAHDSSDRPALMVAGPRGQLWIAASAKIEPMVVADTTQGPVIIDEEAVVTAFTRLEGPCYIGPKTHVVGAKIRAGTSLGPQCRVGGEIEASILHGYSNKYHEGFLGHSYVGEWVNLGAGTHNSDLRNDYGEVTVTVHGLPMHTGLNKVGCFLGDHTKTGLGTLFNTGASVGAFCNLLPAGRFAPKYVPSFTSWWNGSLREAFTLDQLLTTAEIAMQRRGVALTPAHRAFYAWLLKDTDAERRRVMRESEQRQLRKAHDIDPLGQSHNVQ